MDIKDINSPQDIKKLDKKELKDLADNIREFLVESVSETGGHLGSSLGTVELIIAMHYHFNSPEDKFIFDIGHQAYTHKLLTGRAKEFSTLRQKDGLSGFLKRSESEHDVWEAGHSSTSISAAAGFALQRDLDNDDNQVLAVIGDGSLTNGMVMEALNHVIELNEKIIIVINDNEMSISSNVGFINNMLKNLEHSNSYKNTKKVVQKGLNKVTHSQRVSNFISAFKNQVKENINSVSSFFTILGFEYFGPINGHDIDELLETFEAVEEINKPIIVHVKTKKGKGYKPAEANSWHAVAPFDIETGEVKQSERKITNGKIVANYLDKKMGEDKDIVVVSPAMIEGSSLSELEEKYQSRITDAGIAEEHATTLVAALALAGKKPFLSIYSTFLQRSYDQVFHDIVRQNAGVVIGVDRAGLVGEDGETHQGIYDISFLSHMHNLIITQGRDVSEIKGLMDLGFELQKPYVIRYSKGGDFTNEEELLEPKKIRLGEWEELTDGTEMIVISYGESVNDYYKMFKEDTRVGVINARFIKPLDTDMLKKIANKKILVVEEHTRIGGLGSLILDFYNQEKLSVDVTLRAIGDHFVEQGKIQESLVEEEIDPESIKKQVRLLLNEENAN